MSRQLPYVAIFAFASITAQDATSIRATDLRSKPKFEVASVKECKNGDFPPPSISSPGRLSLGCWPLWRLIGDAYETFAEGKVDPLKSLVPFPLESAPAWVNSARYSIDAKVEGPESGAAMRGPMMQALLEDRFRLKVHRETKEVPAYIMTVAKGGPKLQHTIDGSCNHVDPTNLAQSSSGGKPWCLVPSVTRKGPLWVYDVHGMGLGVFSKFLHPDGRSVIDRTGLTGTFDIHLEWEADPADSQPPGDGVASDPSPHSSVIAAIREQLGLQLTPGAGTREFLIIDQIARPFGN